MQVKDKDSSKNSYVIAVDPGILGGLVLYEKGVITKTLRMPLIKEVTKNKEGKKQTKNHLDPKKILQFLKECSEVTTTVVIESQRIGSNDGYKSGLTTAINYGFLKGLIASLDLKVIELAPRTWQTILASVNDPGSPVNMKETKRKSLILANSILSTPTKYDGISDAVCLAEYYVKHIASVK
jgi:hypothetical protein